MDSYSVGYANIALVKYWGKKSKSPVLPFNPNISLRLDKLTSKTKIEKSKTNEDEFYINDIKQTEDEVKKIINFVDKFVLNRDERICIKSYNTVPTAAGLSSSSSGTMALVCACNEYFNLNKTTKELIQISKEGSGSSCRSFYKLASWLPSGEVEELKCDLDLMMSVLVVDENRKKISSREAMQRCVDTSSSYKKWVESATSDYEDMLIALAENNFKKIGKITEKNAQAMHKTCEDSTPSFSFLTPLSYKAMDVIKQIRAMGIECYFTMDAGPNVKVLYLRENHNKLHKELKKLWTGKIIECME